MTQNRAQSGVLVTDFFGKKKFTVCEEVKTSFFWIADKRLAIK